MSAPFAAGFVFSFFAPRVCNSFFLFLFYQIVRLKAKEVTSGVFGALAKCAKNLNPKEDPMLIADAMAELKKVDGERQTDRQLGKEGGDSISRLV